MSRFKTTDIQDDGSSVPIYPYMDRPYKMRCCDCGLVHNISFFIERETHRHENGEFDTELVDDKSLRIMFVVSRNNRSTGQSRRKR